MHGWRLGVQALIQLCKSAPGALCKIWMSRSRKFNFEFLTSGSIVSHEYEVYLVGFFHAKLLCQHFPNRQLNISRKLAPKFRLSESFHKGRYHETMCA